MVSFSTGLLSSLNRCQPSLQFTLQICFVTVRIPGVSQKRLPKVGASGLSCPGPGDVGNGEQFLLRGSSWGRLGDWPAPGFLLSPAQTLGLQVFIGFLDFDEDSVLLN